MSAPVAAPPAAPSGNAGVTKVPSLRWKLHAGLQVVFGSANKRTKADGSLSFSTRLGSVSHRFTIRVNAKSTLAREIAQASGKTGEAPRTQATFHLNRAHDKVKPLEEVVKAYRRHAPAP